MKIKKIVAIVLGFFVVSSVAYWGITEMHKSVSTSTASSETIPTPQNMVTETVVQKERVIDGLYFHGTNRCYTCNLMEGYIRDVLKESFVKEMRSGDLTFNTYNVEDPTYEHFIQDYQLNSISFFLSLKKEGKEIKFSNADRIWKLAQDEKAFKKYIKDEITKFLEI